MKKAIFLLLILMNLLLKSEVNLFIFSGCENEEELGAIHSPLLYSLNAFDYPILVSGSILNYTLNEKCENSICENILEENYIIDKFDVYYYKSFFIFIPIQNKTLYENLFNLSICKKIDLSKKEDLDFSKSKSCTLSNEPNYLTSNLLSDLIQKNNKVFNIFLSGHGDFYNQASIIDFLNKLEIIQKLNRNLNINLNSLSNTELKELKNNIDSEESKKILRKININIKNFLTKNSTQDLQEYISNQIDLINKINEYTENPWSTVAGIPIKEFKLILNFLNDQIETGILFISSCFSGGLNSILPFLKTELNLNKTYNFDIFSLTTSEYAYPNLAEKFDSVIFKENTVDIFLAFTKDTNYKKNYSEILKRYSKGLSEHLLAFTPPIIRKRFSNKWFPVFSRITTLEFNFYNITKLLVDIHLAENRPFNFKSPNTTLITTPCIEVPIKIQFGDKLILRNLPTAYFKEIDFGEVNKLSKAQQKKLKDLQLQFDYSDLQLISILETLNQTFPVIPEQGILIKKGLLTIAGNSMKLENIELRKISDQVILYIALENSDFEVRARMENFINLTDFGVSYLVRKPVDFKNKKEDILTKCPHRDLTEIKKLLEKSRSFNL